MSTLKARPVNPTIAKPWHCPSCKFIGVSSQKRREHYVAKPNHRLSGDGYSGNKGKAKGKRYLSLEELTSRENNGNGAYAAPVQKYCTGCGTKRGRDHRYCGVCGGKYSL